MKLNLFALLVLTIAAVFAVASYKQSQVAIDGARYQIDLAKADAARAVQVAIEASRFAISEAQDSAISVAECHKRMDSVVLTVETLARNHPGRARAPAILSLARR